MNKATSLLPAILLTCLAVTFQARSATPAVPPRASTAQANVHILPPLAIPGLNRSRTIRLYLPPGYDKSHQRYPVLYMHDGQNLFDAATSYAGEWGVDETLNALAESCGLELIVVGVDNGGVERIHELNPWDNAKYGKGEGREYAAFVVDVVKPYIDAHYRSKPDRADTAVMGSSMGGLISQYMVARYPRVFSRVGIFSPAYWLAPQIMDDPAEVALPPDLKMYFYAGGKEGDSMLPDMNRMVARIRQAGHPSRNLAVAVDPDAQHNEAAWRAQFPKAVTWLYGLGKCRHLRSAP